jgi:hypothetical protein
MTVWRVVAVGCQGGVLLCHSLSEGPPLLRSYGDFSWYVPLMAQQPVGEGTALVAATLLKATVQIHR